MVGFDMSGIPALKSSVLLTEAIAVFGDGLNAVDPSIRGRLKREAEALTKTDGAVDAWQVLGMVATYDRDVKWLPIYFKNAMNLSSSFSVVSNFATAWQHVYDYDKAISTLDAFLKNNPYHVDCLRTIADMSSMACMYDKEVEVLATLAKLLPEDDEVSDDLMLAVLYKQIAQDHGMTDSASAQAISFVMRFVRDNGFYAGNNRVTILQDEFDTWIAYHIAVNTDDFDRIIQLNLDLCEAKAGLENGHVLFNNGLSISIEAS
jgi:tetratricopeptide (TPR) repeat protein